MAWLDRYNNPKAQSVNLHRTDIPMKSWSNTGLDLGVVLPSLLDIGNLQMNEKIEPVNANIWKNLDEATPEGYFAVGFPRPWCYHTQTSVANDKILNSVQANLACLPLIKTSPPTEFADDPKWSDPEAFYGQLVEYPDYPSFDLEDVKGMSGGPILSVERTVDNHIRYRLVGIVQSYASGQSIFRAEPIQRIAPVISAWLKNET